MKITKKQVEYVANLARLNLSEDECESLMEDMGNIISFADKLSELDVSGVTPTAQVLPIKNVFRKDEVIESFKREDILKNAPTQENGCFLVPKIVE